MLAELSLPWRDDRDARRFLSALAQTASPGSRNDPAGSPSADPDRSHLAAWLARHGLGALAFAEARRSDPELAALLKTTAIEATATNLSHFEMLERIERRLEAERIEMVLLKGAAVASHAYGDPSLRPMLDLDIWVPDGEVSRAARCLLELGFRPAPVRPDRPPALQRLASGEAVFWNQERSHGVVELHYGPFQGWWVKRTARPDVAGVRRRTRRLGPGRHARRLAAEDAIIQTALHVAVNQFGQAPFRGLMDLSVIARSQTVDWETVASRARAWRVATATWVVLDLADRLIGIPGAERAISLLRPGRARRATLRTLISGKKLASRHLLMLSLTDRPVDATRLIARTLWPERWWIEARYGRPVSRVRHAWGLLRRGAP